MCHGVPVSLLPLQTGVVGQDGDGQRNQLDQREAGWLVRKPKKNSLLQVKLQGSNPHICKVLQQEKKQQH